MYRLAFNFLDTWKNRNNRLPLLIRGARQVGKTWLVREHAKGYESFLEINLEARPEYIKLFKEYFGQPQELVKALSLLSGEKIVPGATLLFIDEIQASKEALLSLRYFKENLETLHVVAAGSLLEFAFQELSFPVGRVEFFHLFPMNFEEYLLARNSGDLLEAVRGKKLLPRVVHEKLLDEVSVYTLIGGMPESVKAYTSTGDLQECQRIAQIHTASFREDFHKYASKANIEYLRIIFDGTPRLLGKKFKYVHIDPAVKSRELSAALRLLEQAGLAYKVHHSSANGLPLASQINPNKFKVFFLDVGLCHRILGLNLSQLYLQKKELLANQGGIAEQFTAQELLSFTPPNQTPQLFYWHREAKSSQAEVDFLTEDEGRVLPIEVKSRRGNSLKSLHLFLKEKEAFAPRGLKVSASPYAARPAGKIQEVPFYALLRLKK